MGSTSISELCKASLMRWPIEQCFNEAKDELGMDHYEFKSWTVWHRHMFLVSIASSFLKRGNRSEYSGSWVFAYLISA